MPGATLEGRSVEARLQSLDNSNGSGSIDFSCPRPGLLIRSAAMPHAKVGQSAEDGSPDETGQIEIAVRFRSGQEDGQDILWLHPPQRPERERTSQSPLTGRLRAQMTGQLQAQRGQLRRTQRLQCCK